MALPQGTYETLDDIPAHVLKGLPDSMKLGPSAVNSSRIGEQQHGWVFVNESVNEKSRVHYCHVFCLMKAYELLQTFDFETYLIFKYFKSWPVLLYNNHFW